MDPLSNAHGVSKEGPSASVRMTANGRGDDCATGPTVSSSPRPAPLASPASSCRGGSVTTPPPSRQAPLSASGGRSVKSIVEWLEGPKRPDSPPATSVASGPARKTTSAATAASAAPTPHRPVDQAIPRAGDVEEYSLTYLNYRGFYLEAPLARCLDGVEEDLSKKPLEDIFKDAERKSASWRAVVNMASASAAGQKAIRLADAKTKTASADTTSTAIRGGKQDSKTAPTIFVGQERQGSIRRDPQEVEAF